MPDFWNFHDTWIVATHNWFWLLVALALGIVVGWKTPEPDGGTKGQGS
ncbi:hypothetical protein BH10PSE7_BH10PSE7_00600 [soil metagenome]